MRKLTDPDRQDCWYGDCPYEEIGSDPELLDLWEFCFTALTSYEVYDETTKQKSKKWGVDGQNFDFACRLFGVEGEDSLREMLRWAQVAARAAMDAPNATTQDAWAARRAERERKARGDG